MSHSATIGNGERVYLSDTPPEETDTCSDYGLCIVTLGDEQYVCGYIRYERQDQRFYYPMPIYGIRGGDDDSCFLAVRTEPYMQFASPREVQVSSRNDPLDILALIQKGNVLESILYLTMTHEERAAARARRLADQQQLGILQGVVSGLIAIGELPMKDVTSDITPEVVLVMPGALKKQFGLNTPYDHGSMQGIDILVEHLDDLVSTAGGSIQITPGGLLDILEALIPVVRSRIQAD